MYHKMERRARARYSDNSKSKLRSKWLDGIIEMMIFTIGCSAIIVIMVLNEKMLVKLYMFFMAVSVILLLCYNNLLSNFYFIETKIFT